MRNCTKSILIPVQVPNKNVLDSRLQDLSAIEREVVKQTYYEAGINWPKKFSAKNICWDYSTCVSVLSGTIRPIDTGFVVLNKNRAVRTRYS